MARVSNFIDCPFSHLFVIFLIPWLHNKSKVLLWYRRINSPKLSRIILHRFCICPVVFSRFPDVIHVTFSSHQLIWCWQHTACQFIFWTKMTRDPIFSFHGFLSVDAMGYNMEHLSLLSPLAAFFSSHIWKECSKENCRPYFISFSLPSGSFLRAKKGIFVTLYPLQIFISGKRVPVFRNNFAPIYHQIFPYPLSFTVRSFKYSSIKFKLTTLSADLFTCYKCPS